MNSLQNILEQVIAGALADKVLSEGDLADVTSKAVERALPGITTTIVGALKRRAPKILREHRKRDAGFRRRNRKRWAAALDLLEMMWLISSEVVVEFDAEHRPKAIETQDYQFDALTHIHARALLVVGEIMCLLNGGYADGALSRWRTLHELAVTASFLSRHDTEVSQRYLASVHFQALRDAEQLKKCANAAGADPLSEEEMDNIKRRCATLQGILGKMQGDYGWAARALNKKKVNFADIEGTVELGHWRLYYRWASQHTHAGYRPRLSMLGTAESVEEIFLVGQSNSGLVEPMEMTAVSLTLATGALLLSRPSFDHIVIMKILSDLTEEIGPLADKLERGSLH